MLTLLKPYGEDLSFTSRRRASYNDPAYIQEDFQALHSSPSGSMAYQNVKSEHAMETRDQSSSEAIQQEDFSVGRLSSSERKSERPARTRAKKGAMSRDFSSDSDEEYEGARRRRSDKRGTLDAKQKRGLSDFHVERPDPITAAKNKANRERQRRERLNDSFAELVKTLDPEGSIKGEKTSIIASTIKSINSLRRENDKLRKDKADTQHQLADAEKEKRDIEFKRAMLEQQLEDLRLSISYNRQPGMQQAIGQQAELAGQMDGMRHPQQASPSGLSRMLQEQAVIQNSGQQGMGAMNAQMFQQQNSRGGMQNNQANGFNSMMDQTMQPGNANFHSNPQAFNPNQAEFMHNSAAYNGTGDFLDIDPILGSSLPDINPDVMSMSPIVWLNESLGPEADESYMCSNL